MTSSSSSANYLEEYSKGVFGETYNIINVPPGSSVVTIQMDVLDSLSMINIAQDYEAEELIIELPVPGLMPTRRFTKQILIQPLDATKAYTFTFARNPFTPSTNQYPSQIPATINGQSADYQFVRPGASDVFVHEFTVLCNDPYQYQVIQRGSSIQTVYDPSLFSVTYNDATTEPSYSSMEIGAAGGGGFGRFPIACTKYASNTKFVSGTYFGVYGSPSFDNANNNTSFANIGIVETCLPLDCTLSRLYVRVASVVEPGATLTITLFVGGVASTLSVTITAGSAVGEDLLNSVFVPKGTPIAYEITFTGNPFNGGGEGLSCAMIGTF